MSELAALRPEGSLIACGDFNESPDEFERVGRRYPTALMPDPDQAVDGRYGALDEAWFKEVILVAGKASAASAENERVVLYSPWAGQTGYSYVFRGKEERLDGFLLGPGFGDEKGLEFDSFQVGNDPKLLDNSGSPLGWNGSTGYSDHLPIACRLRLADGA